MSVSDPWTFWNKGMKMKSRIRRCIIENHHGAAREDWIRPTSERNNCTRACKNACNDFLQIITTLLPTGCVTKHLVPGRLEVVPTNGWHTLIIPHLKRFELEAPPKQSSNATCKSCRCAPWHLPMKEKGRRRNHRKNRQRKYRVLPRILIDR